LEFPTGSTGVMDKAACRKMEKPRKKIILLPRQIVVKENGLPGGK
jgi:hypothetical protein